MLEEIPLAEYKPFFSSMESEGFTAPAIITNGDSDVQQTIVTRIIEQGKNVFSQQPSYLKLVEEESPLEDSDRQQINSNESVLLCKKERGRCLCYIFLIVLPFVLIFSVGFGVGRIFANKFIISSSIQSKYQPIWNNSTSKFILMNTSNSSSYYSAFEIRVIMSANYSFSSESNINTYGYIYNNTFHPDNPSLNLFTASRTSTDNGQFKLTVFLRPWISYILLVTTFSSNATATFFIITSGPTKIALRHILLPQLHEVIYSSEWTMQSEVYCRDRCSTADYDYEFDDDYYYEVISINVNKTADVTIISQSHIDTYGYLYEKNFNLFDTSANLLMDDDNSGNNKQFKLTALLRSTTIYLLVVTSFSPHVMGKFSIIASSTSLISLTHVSSHKTIITATTMPIATTLPTMQSNYNGRLSMSSPMYCRGGCNSTVHYYETVVVSVEKVGNYSFRSESEFDAYGSIYNNSFDPSHPFLNLLDFNDDAGEDVEFNLIIVLQPQTTYILVVTSYAMHATGTFQIIASGPTSVSLLRTINPTTSLSTITPRKLDTTPWSVQSSYSSAWTIDSQSYCRTSCAVSENYHYEAIEVRVGTRGTFSLVSKSLIDTYGYLYNSSFNPFSPSSNLLLQDDESGHNNQFKLTYVLERDLSYILVATTFNPSTTGAFSISGSGPGSVTFSAYITIFIQ